MPRGQVGGGGGGMKQEPFWSVMVPSGQGCGLRTQPSAVGWVPRGHATIGAGQARLMASVDPSGHSLTRTGQVPLPRRCAPSAQRGGGGGGSGLKIGRGGGTNSGADKAGATKCGATSSTGFGGAQLTKIYLTTTSTLFHIHVQLMTTWV